jgi:hypothetical protein
VFFKGTISRDIAFYLKVYQFKSVLVPDPKKGVCADPVDGDAILGRGESGPHSGNRERQLAPDKGRGKT